MANRTTPVEISHVCVVFVQLHKRTVPVPGFVMKVPVSGQVKETERQALLPNLPRWHSKVVLKR